MSYLETYGALSLSTWKEATDILQEVGETRRLKRGERPPYEHLHTLVNETFARRREKDIDEDRLRSRGGRAVFEYALTDEGFRARNDILAKHSGLAGLLGQEA